MLTLIEVPASIFFGSHKSNASVWSSVAVEVHKAFYCTVCFVVAFELLPVNNGTLQDAVISFDIAIFFRSARMGAYLQYFGCTIEVLYQVGNELGSVEGTSTSKVSLRI
jgi:hypothetical protein